MSRTRTQYRASRPSYSPKLWSEYAANFPSKRPPGIYVNRMRIAAPGSFRFLLVGTLAYYDAASDLCGVLFHFADQVDICVSPSHRRQGIGLALWEEAVRRWHVRVEDQTFTPSGARAANGYLRRRTHAPDAQ